MYKCSCCGNEDSFVYGLANISSKAGPKRSSITHCHHCNRYYYYESNHIKVGSQPVKKLELTEDEALELLVKMKSCTDPKDIECSCNTHKFVNAFTTINEYRIITE